MIMKWLKRPAKYWQFWLPQSGLCGGAINAALILVAYGGWKLW